MFREYAKKLKNAWNGKQTENEKYAAVKQFVNAPRQGRLLDIGLGGDAMLQKLSDKRLALYGVDISSADRERSIDEIALMGLTKIDELPYHDEFFDCVTTVDTTTLWEDKMAAFAEILRVLKAGGQLLCAFDFDSDSGEGTPPRTLRESARLAGFENVRVKVLRSEGSYLLIGDKPC
ncbi:methyltransferase domain-containing protein [Ruminococcus sp.]|uniref:class I SAM-dependent methyltransferase n=1 Tax=Ruminococcus sp. TaxID=41978 RepID=UPI0025E22855|nr:methyltransferase domain-containing protein [Ruminococcus sp.]MBQ8967053.1 methyltransferase domain-containing protein [Ruminococcus sp.]